MDKVKLDNLIRSMASSYDPIALARAKVDSYNAEIGHLEYYDCPVCRNKGKVARLGEDGKEHIDICRCMSIRNSFARLERSGMKALVDRMTFARYRATEDWQKQMKAGAMKYAEKPEGWFAICGQSGCGKTHLCSAICRELIFREKDVCYMSWRDEISRLKGLYGDDGERLKRLEELKNIQVLYIDDLFKTGSTDGGRPKPTSADVTVAFEILNYRSNNQLCTIVSTEMLIEEIRAVDEAIAGRIVEMADGRIFSVRRNSSRNYRFRNKPRS